MLPGVHHWRNGFGFVGALLLLVPTVANEVVKRQATRLEARRASLDDGSGRQLLEQELDLLEQHMQRHQRWHAWIYIAGVLLLALEFRLGL
jgi:hypothetical protein